MKKLCSFFVLLLLIVNIGINATYAGTSSSTKAFALINPREASISDLLDHKEVNGLALQLSWAKIETAEGVYDWTEMDNLIEQAKAKKKKITLHILGSVFTEPPNWLKQKGAEFYSYKDFTGKQKIDIIPWDGILLQSYGNFLQGLSDHIKVKKYTNTVYAISLTIPVPEMSLISCRNNMIGSSISYDRAKYLEAWKTILNAGQKSFPKTVKLVSAPVDVICHPTKDSTFYTEIADYIKGKKWKKFMLFATDLTADGSDRMKPYLKNLSSTLMLGYQTIWSATGDAKNRMKGIYPSNLGNSICKGKKDGATYFELYPSDFLNKDNTIQDGIGRIHQVSECP